MGASPPIQKKEITMEAYVCEVCSSYPANQQVTVYEAVTVSYGVFHGEYDNGEVFYICDRCCELVRIEKAGGPDITIVPVTDLEDYKEAVDDLDTDDPDEDPGREWMFSVR